MSKVKVFAVYDSKAEFYGQTFNFRTVGEAIRAFTDEANNEKSQIHNHAEDYTLFQIAEYDNETGRFENCNTPISLGVAVEFKRPDKQLKFPEVINSEK